MCLSSWPRPATTNRRSSGCLTSARTTTSSSRSVPRSSTPGSVPYCGVRIESTATPAKARSFSAACISTPVAARSRSTAPLSSWRARSSTCCSRSPGGPARSSRSATCSPRCGSSPGVARTGRSTSTCPGCGASSASRRGSRATCTACVASASGSWPPRGERDERLREVPRRRDAARAERRGAEPRLRPSAASGAGSDSRRRDVTVRRRILLLVAGITVLVVLAFAIPIALLVRSAVEQRSERSIRDEAAAIAAFLRAGHPSDAAINSYLAGLTQTADRSASVTTPHQRVLGRPPPHGQPPSSPPPRSPPPHSGESDDHPPGGGGPSHDDPQVYSVPGGRTAEVSVPSHDGAYHVEV